MREKQDCFVGQGGMSRNGWIKVAENKKPPPATLAGASSVLVCYRKNPPWP